MKKILALVLAGMLLLLTACGAQTPEQSTQEGGQAQNAPGEADPGSEDPGSGGEGRRVVFMPHSTSEEFAVDVLSGAQRAADALGWEMIAMDPQSDLNTQIQFFEDLQVQGVDGIVFAAIDGSAVGSAVESLKAAGIATIDFDITVDEGNTDATVRSDDVAGGALAAQVLGEAMGGEGTVIIFEEKPGIGAGVFRNQGFREYMEEHYPDIVMVNNRPADVTRDGCRAWMVDMLTAYPDATGVFTYMGDASLGAYYGCRELGRDDVLIMGYDATPEQQQIMIDDGPECQLIASVALFPEKYGRICIETMAAIFDGSYTRGGMDDEVVVEPGLMLATEAETFVQEQ